MESRLNDSTRTKPEGSESNAGSYPAPVSHALTTIGNA